MNLHILIGPIVGGIIGLITNGIAIRMLFRPLHPIKFFGFTLPFTPGIIPNEKPRIAKSSGDVVGKILVNEEVLRRGLLSPQMDNKIGDYIDTTIEKHKDSPLTLREVAIRFVKEERTDTLIETTKEKITAMAYTKVCSMNMGESIAEVAMEEVQKSSMFSAFSFLLSDGALSGIKEKLAETVNDMIINRGEEMINNVIDDETNDILNLTLEELYLRFGNSIPQTKKVIINVYHNIIKNNLSKALNALNIAELVEEQINSFDVMELEKIILSIMKKELNAIIWLGGLLGLLMGFVMNFI
ncbi:MAG: DUF445 family protein [Eubacterium sp.]